LIAEDAPILECSTVECSQESLMRMMITTGLFAVFILGPAAADDIVTTGSKALRCFHPTGTVEQVREAEMPRLDGKARKLPKAASLADLKTRFEAERLVLLHVFWRGALLKAPYESEIAVLYRGAGDAREYRLELVGDTAKIPAIHRVCGASTRWLPAPANDDDQA
jgi:hypothetical protein